MFGAHTPYVVSVYTLFTALILWHLLKPVWDEKRRLAALRRHIALRKAARQGPVN